MWDLNTTQMLAQVVAHQTTVNYLSFSSVREQFLTSGQDKTLRIFDLRDLKTSRIAF